MEWQAWFWGVTSVASLAACVRQAYLTLKGVEITDGRSHVAGGCPGPTEGGHAAD